MSSSIRGSPLISVVLRPMVQSMASTPPRSTGTTRRSFLRAGASALGLIGITPVLTACDLPLVGGGDPAPEMPVEGPEEALQRLIEGNERFATGATKPINESSDRRAKVVQRQRPFAMIFSCVDSRVPPELIFDRGLGDLFVVRTAGHAVDHAVMGSLEYGAYELEVPLLMVLGHKKCGAVKATMEAVEAGAHAEGSIEYLVDAIRPAVTGSAGAHGAGAHGAGAHGDDAAAGAHGDEIVQNGTREIQVDDPAEAAALAEELEAGGAAAADGEAASAAPDALTEAVTRNVALAVKRVSVSPLVAERIKKDRLLVVGGVYDLETGLVTLTENVPDQFKPPTAAPVEGEAAG
jgi:carbonic anhydrase